MPITNKDSNSHDDRTQSYQTKLESDSGYNPSYSNVTPNLVDREIFQPNPDGTKRLIGVPRNVLYPESQPPVTPQNSTVYWNAKK